MKITKEFIVEEVGFQNEEQALEMFCKIDDRLTEIRTIIDSLQADMAVCEQAIAQIAQRKDDEGEATLAALLAQLSLPSRTQKRAAKITASDRSKIGELLRELGGEKYVARRRVSIGFQS